jgi:hypothetical protein
MAANESSAIVSVRQIVSAENAFFKSRPNSGYTCRLSDLSDAGLIDKTLGTARKNGYNFELSGCGSGTSKAKYLIVAYPVTVERTGRESFCSDESGVVKTDITGSREHCMIDGSASP